MSRDLLRRVLPWLLAGVLAMPGVSAAKAEDLAPPTKASEVSGKVERTRSFALPRPATHVAVHWRGHPEASVEVAFSRDGADFGSWRPVQLDEAGMDRPGPETYGAVMVAPGVRAVRVRTDVALERLSVVGLTDGLGAGGTRNARTADASPAPDGASVAASSAVQQPPVTPRSGWGADESLRFDSNGDERWPPQFWPLQKLIVHHTVTANNDPNPAATIRSIYHYHAITQGWGDIGYNFLIDQAGKVYEGRYSRVYPSGASPSGQDADGNGVTGAHAKGSNAGSVGIALLGNLANQNPTPAARESLERLLAWEADAHGIDPLGSSVYTSPVYGTRHTFPNIAGHRDVLATQCPGGSFYATLPAVRSDVAARVAAAHPPAQAKSYEPDGYRILSGSVYRGRGDVARLYADDDRRLQISAEESGGRHVSNIYAYAAISPAERDTLSKLVIEYDGSASGTDTAVTLHAYDWSSRTWKAVDEARKGITTDRSLTWTSSTDPVRYVSPTGEVRFRVRGRGPRAFRTRTDLVKFKIAY